LPLQPRPRHPTSVAAARPNEKAECRYLLDLCQRLSGSMASLDEVVEVAHVIRAKHDKVPACLADCKMDGVKVFDLNKFK
jgi:hypothetical protein